MWLAQLTARDYNFGNFMRVIVLKLLKSFWDLHPDSKQPLLSWYNEVKNEIWDTPADVKARYPSASVLGGNRVEFSIMGNNYKLMVVINYLQRTVFVGSVILID